MNTEGHHGHYEPQDYDRSQHKVLVMRAIFDDDDVPAAEHRVLSLRGRRPIAEVTVNLGTGRVVRIDQPPTTVRWGAVPTPIF